MSEASGSRALAPPSSLSRLNPSISIPKEGDHHRSPFQATASTRSNHAALIDDFDEEECNRLGSVFVGCCVRLST